MLTGLATFILNNKTMSNIILEKDRPSKLGWIQVHKLEKGKIKI